MLGGLKEDRSSALSTLTAKLLDIGPENIVLCGHSLGDGYAMITAAELLQQGLPVSSIYTFGAPMVFAKKNQEIEHPIWQQLHEKTHALVFNCDIVPRTLSNTAEEWVFSFVKNYLLSNYISAWVASTAWFLGYGDIDLCDAVVQQVANLESNADTIYEFSPCGTVPFFSHRFKDQREELVRGYSEESLELRQAVATEAGDGYPVTVDAVLSDRPEASVRLLRRLCDSPGECASDSTFLKDHSTVNYTMCARAAPLYGLVRHPQ
jgi:hypothetical protein